MKKKKLNNRGFTLVELLASIGIFSMMMTLLIMTFKEVTVSQRVAISLKNTQENLSYSLEVISKELRQVKRADNDCEDIIALLGEPAVVAANKVFNTASSSKILYFKNKNDECVAYYMNEGRLYIARDSNLGDGLQNNLPVTPDEITIVDLNFFVTDDLIAAPLITQARVTVRMTAESIALNPSVEHSMDIQTTITARYYEGN
ncbi:prepilin-type N-terminal cleavage/methylation domain-containing protein [bacterium]|nr:prepilin-type N-terminal cleavage/methylation domain-containing protein [bacterium]